MNLDILKNKLIDGLKPVAFLSSVLVTLTFVSEGMADPGDKISTEKIDKVEAHDALKSDSDAALKLTGAGTYVMCKSGSAVRTIRVQKKNNSCRTLYTKEGVDATVSKSVNPTVCGDVAGRIKVNLESSNWKCKDISNARLSENFN
jgi:hypothetical protein